MRNESLVGLWLKRAKSNLDIARAGKVFEDILYEDLCFDCEQAVEKALKALLVSIAGIWVKAQNNSLFLPESVLSSYKLVFN